MNWLAFTFFVAFLLKLCWAITATVSLSRCRELLYAATEENSRLFAGYDALTVENEGLLSIIADHDAELAKVSLERDGYKRQLDGLNTMAVIDFAGHRQHGKPQITYQTKAITAEDAERFTHAQSV